MGLRGVSVLDERNGTDDGVVYMGALELGGYITTAFKGHYDAIMRHEKAKVAYGIGFEVKFMFNFQFPIPKTPSKYICMTWHETVPRSSRYVCFPHPGHPIPPHSSIYMSRQQYKNVNSKK